MKKQELLTKLGTKFYKVGEVQKQREAEGVNYYLVGVYEKDGDTLVRSNISFYVENEGKVSEAAYWHQVEPKQDLPINIKQEALTYLSGLTGVTMASQNNMIATVYVKEGEILKEKRVLVFKKDGQIQHLIVE